MTARADLIADAALALLAERGMRGLTHRAVDEAAGLPQGSTSNYARTRQALLETAVRRLADREAQVLFVDGMPAPPAGGTEPDGPNGAGAGEDGANGPDGDGADGRDGDGADGPAGPGGPGAPGDGVGPGGMDRLLDALSLALHRYLTDHRELLVARYELGLEATRRPELRTFYDETGRRFREPLTDLMRAAGSTRPERHMLSLVAWCEGLMFSCAVGSFHSSVPSPEELRTGFGELLAGMLGGPPDAGN
ncbi:TetR/AcrR family transcriptional regulator [Streptomyces lavendulocolor]|uniref:TetR/AcrR family transcriptional regulator n=1 Tax=Streptomyces lavendulocolor TaxID=67316 RepID=UPI003C30D3A2